MFDSIMKPTGFTLDRVDRKLEAVRKKLKRLKERAVEDHCNGLIADNNIKSPGQLDEKLNAYVPSLILSLLLRRLINCMKLSGQSCQSQGDVKPIGGAKMGGVHFWDKCVTARRRQAGKRV